MRTHGSLSLSKDRIAAIKAISDEQGLTVAGVIDKFIASQRKIKHDPLYGWKIAIGPDHIQLKYPGMRTVTLTLEEARNFQRDAALTVTGRESFAVAHFMKHSTGAFYLEYCGADLIAVRSNGKAGRTWSQLSKPLAARLCLALEEAIKRASALA